MMFSPAHGPFSPQSLVGQRSGAPASSAGSKSASVDGFRAVPVGQVPSSGGLDGGDDVTDASRGPSTRPSAGTVDGDADPIGDGSDEIGRLQSRASNTATRTTTAQHSNAIQLRM